MLRVQTCMRNNPEHDEPSLVRRATAAQQRSKHYNPQRCTGLAIVAELLESACAPSSCRCSALPQP